MAKTLCSFLIMRDRHIADTIVRSRYVYYYYVVVVVVVVVGVVGGGGVDMVKHCVVS